MHLSRKQLRAHYLRRSGRRLLGRNFLLIFGGLWLAIEPIGFFWPGDQEWGRGGFAALIAVSAIAAAVRTRPKSSIDADVRPSHGLHVEVRLGDVLDQKGNVVIGANDCFDTTLTGGVISKKSVQGQLLTRIFEGDRTALDDAIAASLPPGALLDPSKTFGKRYRYPIGTVAVVERGDARYFLPAFTRMQSDEPKVRSSLEDLVTALSRTWAVVDAFGQREPVHIPVLGSQMARIPLSRTLLIQVIVLSYLSAGGFEQPPDLTIYIHPSDAHRVDLAAIDEWLRSVCEPT